MRETSWPERFKSAQNAEAHIPEMAGLTPLLGELKVLEKAEAVRDKNLFFDLDNLLKGCDDVSLMREAGLNSEGLNQAVADLAVLYGDLKHRCAEAMRGRIEQIRVHASVSSHRAVQRESGPLDLTEEFRLLHAHPTPKRDVTDNLKIVETGFVSDLQMGSVSGAALFFLPDDGLTIAPADSVVLPEDSSITINKGDALILHTQGVSLNGGLAESVEYKTTIVEAREDGVRVNGPALFSLSELPKGALQALSDSREIVDDPKTNTIFNEGNEFLLLLFLMFSACLSLTLIFLLSAPSPYPAIFPAIPIPFCVYKFFAILKTKAGKRAEMKRRYEAFNGWFSKQAWKETLTVSEKFVLHKIDDNVQFMRYVVDKAKYEYIRASGKLLKGATLRFLPARFAFVDPNKGVRVIERLPAIEHAQTSGLDNVVPLREARG